jgi:hypothetical protein
MKKILMTLAAVLCCTMTTTVFTACESEESYPTTYGYEVVQETDITELFGTKYYLSSEAQTVQAAFNNAIGTDGKYYNMHDRSMDSEMKSACAQVQSRYANNLESIYMKFNLIRTTATADPDKKDTKEIIGTYELGKAVNTPYVVYSVETSSTESLDALEAKKSELGDSIYEECKTSLLYLLGYASSSGGVSIHRKSVYESQLGNEKVTGYPYKDSEENSQKVCDWCNYITGHLEPLTLAVNGTVNVVKTGLLNKQKTVVWTKTFEPNIK